jgi:DNA-binding MarR family transcriptional regulator
VSKEQVPQLSTLKALDLWYDVQVRALQSFDVDLSARQSVILMHVYVQEGPHTIRSLSEKLHISKAAVCRAVDTLSIAKLLKRKKDEKDRRNVFVQRTIQGSVFLSDFADIIMQVAEPRGLKVSGYTPSMPVAATVDS